MPVPGFQELTLPMLKLSSDGAVWSLADARGRLAEVFGLSTEDQEELLPSGKQSRYANRVAWAKVYLERGGLLSSPARGKFAITDRGRAVLQNPPEAITIDFLSQYQEFQEFRSRSTNQSQEEIPQPNSAESPEEALESAYLTIRRNLASEILGRVKSCSPRFFEHLVVELLLKMGYGKAGGAGERVGQSGDEGIDGIISEDRLGLEMVYLQAKRWEGTVGRPEIQKFVGALHGRRARKGVFITTGTFSAEAVGYVQNIDPRIALIDGSQLAEFMIDFSLGVSLSRAFELKNIDSDFFEEQDG
ncbi:MAG: restriction endonuclease [Pseudomonadales bacterium]|nr:restriction endonuclease [Pseudomonadales bacterium]MCB1669388.1 restriction endonuclease [Pseudomonadales bacterium]MCP5344557.1 restriction endonuclease [Pseudomonadales bacterium]